MGVEAEMTMLMMATCHRRKLLPYTAGELESDAAVRVDGVDDTVLPHYEQLYTIRQIKSRQFHVLNDGFAHKPI